MEKRGLRDQMVVLSKCCHPDLSSWTSRVNAEEMQRDLAQSLEALQTDYIDIYLLHRDDPRTEVGELVETFNAMHVEGRSEHSAAPTGCMNASRRQMSMVDHDFTVNPEFLVEP